MSKQKHLQIITLVSKQNNQEPEPMYKWYHSCLFASLVHYIQLSCMQAPANSLLQLRNRPPKTCANHLFASYLIHAQHCTRGQVTSPQVLLGSTAHSCATLACLSCSMLRATRQLTIGNTNYPEKSIYIKKDILNMGWKECNEWTHSKQEKRDERGKVKASPFKGTHTFPCSSQFSSCNTAQRNCLLVLL